MEIPRVGEEQKKRREERGWEREREVDEGRSKEWGRGGEGGGEGGE